MQPSCDPQERSRRMMWRAEPRMVQRLEDPGSFRVQKHAMTGSNSITTNLILILMSNTLPYDQWLCLQVSMFPLSSFENYSRNIRKYSPNRVLAKRTAYLEAIQPILIVVLHCCRLCQRLTGKHLCHRVRFLKFRSSFIHN